MFVVTTCNVILNFQSPLAGEGSLYPQNEDFVVGSYNATPPHLAPSGDVLTCSPVGVSVSAPTMGVAVSSSSSVGVTMSGECKHTDEVHKKAQNRDQEQTIVLYLGRFEYTLESQKSNALCYKREKNLNK